jgi:hypothetical protein
MREKQWGYRLADFMRRNYALFLCILTTGMPELQESF